MTLKATTTYTNGFTFRFQNLAFTSNVEDLETYVGTTAAGDELEITRIEESSWGIRTKTSVDFDDWAEFALTDVAPAQAESWKGKLGALCVCSIERNVLSDRPFTVFSSSQKLQPRKEAPFDGTRTNNEILVTDVEFWIYHVRNGDVIAKFDADGRRIDAPKEDATSSRPGALGGANDEETQVEYESGIGREDVLRKLGEMQRLQILKAGRRGGY